MRGREDGFAGISSTCEITVVIRHGILKTNETTCTQGAMAVNRAGPHLADQAVTGWGV